MNITCMDIFVAGASIPDVNSTHFQANNMLHRTIATILTISACFIYCSTGLATDNAPPKSSIDASTQKALQMRKNIIRRHFPLTPAEAQNFWPLYDEYEIELTRLYQQRKEYIAKLGNHFDNMTDEMALQIITENMTLQEERLHIMHHYLQKFENVLPGKKLLRFYQIESRFRSAIDAEIAEKIPLLK